MKTKFNRPKSSQASVNRARANDKSSNEEIVFDDNGDKLLVFLPGRAEEPVELPDGTEVEEQDGSLWITAGPLLKRHLKRKRIGKHFGLKPRVRPDTPALKARREERRAARALAGR